MWAEFPDIVGCFGYGTILMECAEGASDALETHLAAMEADGVALPHACEPDVVVDGTVGWL